jgi:acyl transferase domain-containing protein
MGHSEAASGICGIIKSLLAFENQKMSPTIHFKVPRPDCETLVEGRLKVVDKVTDFDGKLIAVNSFGFGGEILTNFNSFDLNLVPQNRRQWPRTAQINH